MKPIYKTISFDVANAVAPSAADIATEMRVQKNKSNSYFVAVIVLFVALFMITFYLVNSKQPSESLAWGGAIVDMVIIAIILNSVGNRSYHWRLHDSLLPISAANAPTALALCQNNSILARYQNAVVSQGRELTGAELNAMLQWNDGAAQRQKDEAARKALEALRSNVEPISIPEP